MATEKIEKIEMNVHGTSTKLEPTSGIRGDSEPVIDNGERREKASNYVKSDFWRKRIFFLLNESELFCVTIIYNNCVDGTSIRCMSK